MIYSFFKDAKAVHSSRPTPLSLPLPPRRSDAGAFPEPHTSPSTCTLCQLTTGETVLINVMLVCPSLSPPPIPRNRGLTGSQRGVKVGNAALRCCSQCCDSADCLVLGAPHHQNLMQGHVYREFILEVIPGSRNGGPTQARKGKQKKEKLTSWGISRSQLWVTGAQCYQDLPNGK